MFVITKAVTSLRSETSDAAIIDAEVTNLMSIVYDVLDVVAASYPNLVDQVREEFERRVANNELFIVN